MTSFQTEAMKALLEICLYMVVKIEILERIIILMADKFKESVGLQLPP